MSTLINGNNINATTNKRAYTQKIGKKHPPHPSFPHSTNYSIAGKSGEIHKIEKKDPKPVLKPGEAQQSAQNLQQEAISYYQIPVDYEIKGNFLGYIKFKRAVSKQQKMLNFDKETISIVQDDSTGAIVARGELTIVGMPDEFF